MVFENKCEERSFKINIKDIFKIEFSILNILAFILGYFYYKGFDGAFAVLLLSIILDFALLLSLIPFGGWLIFFIIANWFVIPWVFEFTGITASWVTNLVFLIDFACSILVSIIVSIVVILYFREW